jgi:hypothetical protein
MLAMHLRVLQAGRGWIVSSCRNLAESSAQQGIRMHGWACEKSEGKEERPNVTGSGRTIGQG